MCCVGVLLLRLTLAPKKLTSANRYGMERFKPAAGRLATVYYKRGALQKPAKFKRDIESRKSELESPPTDMTGSKEKAISPNRSQNLLSAGHTFLWQDLSLDIKSGAEDKRLLEKVTGE